MAAKQRSTTRKKTATKSTANRSQARATSRASGTKTAAKKASASKASSKKASAKKTTKKATTPKATSKKATAKKPAARKTAAKKTTTKKAPAKKTAATRAGTKSTAAKSTAKNKRAAAKSTVDGVKAIRPERAKKSTKKVSSATEPDVHGAVGSSATANSRAQAAEKAKPKEADVPNPNEPTTEELWTRYRTEVDRLAAAGLDEEPELPSGRPAAARNKLGSPELEAIRNALIERYHPLVRYIAERLLQTLPKSIELDDLISAGLFGLMDAIRGFDPDRGIKFKTYCSTRIRGSILDQLRSQDWVPRLVRLKAGRIEKALQQLTGEFGREPTHAELAKALEMEHTELTLEMRESQAKTMFSLSEKWDDEDDGSIEKVEILEDHDAIDPVQELNRRDLMRFITRALTHKERFIIEQYYQYGHTMREIGEMLTLTESRVCQIHSNVMNRLKDLLDQRTDTLVQ